jgi:hypothetical protein
MANAALQGLEANELLFLEQHRSAVWNLDGGRLYISSSRSVKTWNFLGAIETRDPAALIDSAEAAFSAWEMTPCVKVTPFTSSGVEPLLERRGWREDVRLAHMVLPIGPITTNERVAVRLCASKGDIREFSEIQSTGFGVPDWVSWVDPINQVNLRRTNQR